MHTNTIYELYIYNYCKIKIKCIDEKTVQNSAILFEPNWKMTNLECIAFLCTKSGVSYFI